MIGKIIRERGAIGISFLRKNIKNDQKVLSAKIHSKKMMHTDFVMGL